MLEELSINNFTVIEKLTVNFKKGMTAVTGETGAGKSIIIDAIGLIIGNRGSTDFIRKGSDKSVLQGVFTFDKKQTSLADLLTNNGINFDDYELIIIRELHANGRSVCRINGLRINLNLLKLIGSLLVDIHGQLDNQLLTDPNQQLKLLDQYDSKSIESLKKDYQTIFENYQDVQKQLNSKTLDDQNLNQRIDILEFQNKEIQEADLQLNEEEGLQTRLLELENFQNISQALSASSKYFNDEQSGSILDGISEIRSQINSISDLNDNYQKMAEDLDNVYYSLQEVGADISDQLYGLNWDEEELNNIGERLQLIQNLKRKYGNSIEEILNYKTKIEQELDDINNLEHDHEKLEQQMLTLTEDLNKSGQLLSKKRQAVAVKIEQALVNQLKDLFMSEAAFKINIKTLEKPTHNGFNQICFYLQANPGEESLPLEKVSSGGETARMMLAIKTVFAKDSEVSSMIFDEIDTGVSGRVAQSMGDKMHEISNYIQVLCITHLPQVSSVSDHQMQVYKQIENNRTRTGIRTLDQDGREQEIARMLSGNEVTNASLKQAQELLKHSVN